MVGANTPLLSVATVGCASNASLKAFRGLQVPVLGAAGDTLDAPPFPDEVANRSATIEDDGFSMA